MTNIRIHIVWYYHTLIRQVLQIFLLFTTWGVSITYGQVTPDRLNERLFTGTKAEQAINITNSTDSIMSYEVVIDNFSVSNSTTSPTSRLPLHKPKHTKVGQMSHTLPRLDGVRVLLLSQDYEYEYLNSNLNRRGATLEIKVERNLNEDLNEVDILLIDISIEDLSVSEVSTIRHWVSNGGSLGLIGYDSIPMINQLLAGTGAKAHDIRRKNGPIYDLKPHPILEGYNSFFMTGSLHYYEVNPPAYGILFDQSSRALLTVSHFGQGKILAFGLFNFEDYYWDLNRGDLYVRQSIDWLAGKTGRWLSANTEEGTIPKNSMQQIGLTFDTYGLAPNTYYADLIIRSNDTTDFVIPVSFEVFGSVQIETDVNLLTFDSLYLGQSTTRKLTIKNPGTESLYIDTITFAHPTFLIDSLIEYPIIIGPNARQQLTIKYNALHLGISSSALNIRSNAPNSTIQVTLTGIAEAFDIAVNPDSLSLTILGGNQGAIPLSIRNLSEDSLNFSIELIDYGRQGAANTGLHNEFATLGKENSLQNQTTPQAVSSMLEHKTNDLIEIDTGHNNSTTQNWKKRYYIESPLDYDKLADADVLIVDKVLDALTERDQRLIHLWVNSGKSLLLLGVAAQSQEVTNKLLLGTGIQFNHIGLIKGAIQEFLPHPVTKGLNKIDNVEYEAYLSVDASATTLAKDNFGRPHLAVAQVGLGRVMAIGSDLEVKRALSNQAYEWLYVSGQWLALTQQSGVVPPGDSLLSEVLVDARRSTEGQYTADLRITTNGSANPALVVPVNVEVTGVPRLDVADSVCTFSNTYVGLSASTRTMVGNMGTGALQIDSITFASPEFFADSVAFPFTLVAGQFIDLPVVFAPKVSGLRASKMTIYSDGNIQPAQTVPLKAYASVPPAITISSDSLQVYVRPGQQADATFIIKNSESDSVLSYLVNAIGGQVKPLGISLEILEGTYESITTLIPNRYNFVSKKENDFIRYGNKSIYSAGNYISTNRFKDLSYTNKTVKQFGGRYDGQYFTALYPGLFVFAADTDITEFLIEQSPYGSRGLYANGFVIDTVLNGQRFLGFVKRAFKERKYTFQPETSFNQLVIVPYSSEARQSFFDDRWDAEHRVYGLSGQQRIYYLLYTPENSFFVDEATTASIMVRFLNIVGGAPDYLNIDRITGQLPSGGNHTITARFNAKTLPLGTYANHIEVFSNDPLKPIVQLPFKLHVIDESRIRVYPASLHFGTAYLGQSIQDTLTIENFGTDTLAVFSLAIDNESFKVSQPNLPLTISPKSSYTTLVTYTPTQEAQHMGSLVINSDAANGEEITVPLTGIAVAPPFARLMPDTLYATLAPGTTGQRALTIDNSEGLGELRWEMALQGVDTIAPWATLSISSGTIQAGATQLVNVGFDATAVDQGMYAARIVFNSNDPINPVLYAGLSLEVRSKPGIMLSAPRIHFGQLPIGQRADTLLTASNIGNDTLTVSAIDLIAGRGNFSINPISVPFGLVPGQSRNLMVSFTPNIPRYHAARIRLVSNDPNRPRVMVNLLGEGIQESLLANESSELTSLSNYPNPFSDQTTIQYRVPEAGQVSLAVYDMSGRLIATLAHHKHSAGMYTVPFNSGSLPKGLYWYKLTTAQAILVKQMALE